MHGIGELRLLSHLALPQDVSVVAPLTVLQCSGVLVAAGGAMGSKGEASGGPTASAGAGGDAY